MPKHGQRAKRSAKNRQALTCIVIESRAATLEETQVELERCTGAKVYEQTLISAPTITRWSRVRAGSTVEIRHNESATRRYGHADAHCRLGPEKRYQSCLADADWRLVEALFDNTGQRTEPPAYSRRLMVDGCCYVVHTGCAWRLLPKDSPPWQNVCRSIRG